MVTKGVSQHEETINEAYYNWLLSQVNMRKSRYSRLMRFLFEEEFIFSLSRDMNRAVDGEDLKYRFAYERGYSYDYISKALDRPCSVLEMMAALCLRCQEYIVVDSGDNRLSGELFMDMLSSLRLEQFVDVVFNENIAKRYLDDFMAGYGPLFGGYDGRLRTEELWDQAMRHLNELMFEGSMAL